jgi:hypothetical protein
VVEIPVALGGIVLEKEFGEGRSLRQQIPITVTNWEDMLVRQIDTAMTI